MAEDQRDLNQEPQRSSSRGIWPWLFIGLILYVLGIGPAVLLHKRTKNQQLKTTIKAVYVPMEWLHDTPLRKPLEWWVTRWVGNRSPF